VTLGGGGPIATAIARDPAQGLLSITDDGRHVSLGGRGWTATASLLERSPDGIYRPVTDMTFESSTYAAAPPEPGDPWWVGVAEADTTELRLYRLDGSDGPDLVAGWSDTPAGVTGDIDPSWKHFVLGTRTSIEVFALDSGEWTRSLELPSGAVEVGGPSGVRFDASGERLLVSSPTGASHIYDTTTWTRIEGIAEELDIALGYWSGDGTLIATASADGQVTVRDGSSFEVVIAMVGAVGTGNSWAEGALMFSPDNSLLVSNHDNVGRLWDVASGQQVGVDVPTDEGTSSGVNSGATLQLVTGTAHSALVWDLDTDSWVEIACRTAGSNLSRVEWEQWGPRDEDHRAICDQHPADG